MKKSDQWLFWSIMIVALQWVVIDQFQVSTYITPYAYVLVLLLAPARWERGVHIGLGILVGMIMDFHYMTGGLHLMACSLLGFVRPWLTQAVMPRAKEEDLEFTVHEIGHGPWLLYSLWGVGIHHIWMLLWDAFRWDRALYWLGQSSLSRLATLMLIWLIAITFPRRRS